MITVGQIEPIQNVMFQTFATVKPLIFVLAGVEIGLFLLTFVVSLIRRKADEQSETRQAIKQMAKLRAYAKQHNLTLVGDYAPKIAGKSSASEQEYNDMLATAKKYGVQVKSPAGEKLTSDWTFPDIEAHA
jgi:hypothetical protein